MADEGSWRTPTFRQSVVTKIEEAIRQSGMPTSRNSVEMENHVFQKAKTKEEYLGFVARLILHVREINTKKGGGMSATNGNQGSSGMPDPINALQNLASQGSRNQQMMTGPQQIPPITATNLLQTLNHRPGQGLKMPMVGMGGPNGQPQMVPGQMGPGQMVPGQMVPGQMVPGQMGQGQMGPGQMGPGQMGPGQMGPGQMGPGQMGPGQMGPGQMGPGQMGPGQMGPGQMGPGQMGAGQMGTQQMMNMNLMPRKPDGAPIIAFPRNQSSQQFLRQSPTPQSPASLGANQMVASPALVPSPSPMMSQQRSIGTAASPSSSLNTPGQAVPTPSPIGIQDDQAYREKVRQLSKYIEPLRKMTARMGIEGEHVEKLSKMKKLLDILSNPSQRMPLETLIKCEVVLEKLDFSKRGDGGSVGPHLTFKEHHIFNPLLEAVNQNLQTPVVNHTLHRTFGPTLEALFGPELKLAPPLKRKRMDDKAEGEIKDVLQGEIARLDQRFKVSLDPSQQPGSKTIRLLCWLDDRHLPCVPPVALSVPEDYPKSPPRCHMSPHEYDATKFLSDVQSAFLARISKLPRYFSVSQLLDTWEMSVRQACGSKPPETVTQLEEILVPLPR